MLEVVGSSQKEAIFKSSNIKLTMTSHSYKESIMELALKTYHCTKCPSYIRRFWDFVNHIQNLSDLPESSILVSFDVVDLYTLIYHMGRV